MAITLIRRIIPAALMVAAAMGLQAAHAQEGKSLVLARLGNGETITEQDFNQYLGRRVDLKPAGRNASGATMVVQEMAMARALALEGQDLGVPRGAGKANERFDDVYALAVYNRISPACEAPKSEAAARDFYDKNPKAFTVPTSVRLGRIMLPVGARVDDEHAGIWLMNQVQPIGAGGQKFEDVAAKAQKAYQLETQGDLGWVGLSDDNQILRALADANQGDMVGPVKDGDFVYLFKINGKRPAQLVPWADASAVAAKRAVSYCREQTRIDVQARLFKKYDVQLDDKAVRGLFDAK